MTRIVNTMEERKIDIMAEINNYSIGKGITIELAINNWQLTSISSTTICSKPPFRRNYPQSAIVIVIVIPTLPKDTPPAETSIN